MTSSVKSLLVKGFCVASFSVAFTLGFGLTGTHAQVPVAGNDLTITASKTTPAPGENVTITVRSYSIDINSATISWSVNGVSQKRGVGLTTLSLTAPALGKSATVAVSATTGDGAIVRGTLTVASASIDLVTETSGYTPPFFAGKLDPVYQNTTKIIAVPHLARSDSTEYDPTTLVYQWKKDDRVLESDSGYGKQTLSITQDVIPRPYIIQVLVRTRDAAAHGDANITIDSVAPFITFYIDDPLYGPLFNKSLGSSVRIGSEREVGVRAVPFGFNKPQGGIEKLSWVWSINGLERADLTAHENIVLRAPDGSAGSSAVNVTIRNDFDILQGADAGLDVIFSATPSTSPNPTAF